MIPAFFAAIGSFSEEVRLSSSGRGPLQWVVGAFFEHLNRVYGQDLPTPGYDAIILRLLGPGLSSADQGAPPDTPFFSDLHYNFKQSALFGEATYRFNARWALTGGLRYYDFNEDRTLTFAGFSGPYITITG